MTLALSKAIIEIAQPVQKGNIDRELRDGVYCGHSF
jgi:hypothetical protein